MIQLLLLVPLVQGTAAAPAATPTNLVTNPSAEAGGKAPDAWRKGQPVPGVAYGWADDVAADGRRSLSLEKAVKRYFPIAQWKQEITYDGRAPRLHCGSLVKARKAHKAILDVQFEDAAGETSHQWAAYIGAKAEDDPPADHDWMWYSGVVEVPRGTKQVRVGLQIYGPGQVWFDRVFAAPVDDTVEATVAVDCAAMPAQAWGSLPAAAIAPARAASAQANRRTIDGDDARTYFVHGARAQPATKGHGLLIVLPGGDGSADFQPFVQRIAENAAPGDYIVAQAVAPAWSRAKDIVWPRRSDRPRDAAPTEDFVHAIIAAVREEQPIDADRIFLLGWSSGGPPCYAIALAKDSPVRGALVAMSVFKPEGSLAGAKGRAFYVLHSPQDFIAMRFPEAAVKDLARAGATTILQTYEGGHGWHGDVFGMVRSGVDWLAAQTTKARK